MTGIVILVHVVTCISLMLIVLIQSGKGSGIGDLFGGGSTQSFLGSGGGQNVITRITYGLFFTFLLTSITLAWLPKNTGSSKLQQELKNELFVTPTPSTSSPIVQTPSTSAPSIPNPQNR